MEERRAQGKTRNIEKENKKVSNKVVGLSREKERKGRTEECDKRQEIEGMNKEHGRGR